jgi:ParB family chromosome partitioning protein
MGHARVLVGIENAEEQNVIRRKIVEKGLSVRQVEDLARKRRSNKKRKDFPGEAFHYFQSLEVKLKQSLGTKVQIRTRGKQGRIVIHFYSDEELDRLLERLT